MHIKKESGVTLVEILAVVVVIGLISLLIVSSITTSREVKLAHECVDNLVLIKKARAIWRTNHVEFVTRRAPTLKDLGLTNITCPKGGTYSPGCSMSGCPGEDPYCSYGMEQILSGGERNKRIRHKIP